MKKTVFTLLLLAVVSLVSAQTLQFENEGTVYQDGQTIVCPFDEDFGEYVQHMQIRNLTNNELNVVMEQYVIETVPGAMVSLCWGLCSSADTIITRPVPVAAQSLSTEELSFHCMFTEGETGAVTAKYYAYDEGDPDNKISLTVIFGHGTNVTENSLTLGSAYPNPASSQVHFDFKANSSSNINVMVYNLLGQEVKSQVFSGNQGRISVAVDDLQPGIYFCSFQINNEVVKTEKFIVRR